MDNKTLVNDASYLLSQTDARRFCTLSALFHCLAEITIVNVSSTCQICNIRKKGWQDGCFLGRTR